MKLFTYNYFAHTRAFFQELFHFDSLYTL